MLEAARAKMDAGDLAGAQTLANDLLQQFPNSPNAPGAQLMLGRIRLKTTPDATQDLLTAFSLVRTKYPQSAEAADALVHIGYLHSRSRTAESVADFESFIKSYPNHAETARVSQSLGRLYLRTNDLDKAEASFDKVKGIPNASTSVAGEAALQSGFVKIMKYYASKDRADLQPAIAALGACATSKNVKVRARAALGIAEATLLLKKPTEAHAKYLAAAQEFSSIPYFRGIALYGMALCSQQTGLVGRAAKEYADVLLAQSGKTLTEKERSWKAYALASTSQNAQVRIQNNGDWQTLPGSDMLRLAAYQYGRCLYLMSKYDEAMTVLSDLIQALPDGDAMRIQATQLRESCRDAKEGM